jgi:serine/threonine protein kinase
MKINIYKHLESLQGTLPNGCEVAVKQLYAKSQQSLDDFLNEIVLVAAVKHRNLVKLKGCCIRKDQRLLVYEYVENGDLEQFLFGNLHPSWWNNFFCDDFMDRARTVDFLQFCTAVRIFSLLAF